MRETFENAAVHLEKKSEFPLLLAALFCLPLILGVTIASGAVATTGAVVPVFMCLTAGIETVMAYSAIRFVVDLEKPVKESGKSDAPLYPYA